MHACGHDGHTANLLATARVLANTSERPNNVTLLFQPAEEGGAGAKRMIEDGALNGSRLGKPVDQIYGLHGWPELPAGQVATRIGPLLAATDEFSVTIRGKGGHAAYPHGCTDPIVVAAHIVTALQTIASRRVMPVDAVVVTVGSIHAGSAHNVIPDTAQFIGTIRSLTDATRTLAEEEFRHITSTVAEAFGATAEIGWQEGYPTTKNHPDAVRRFRSIAEGAIGAENVIDKDEPTMGGEDFSFYTAHAPSCFFFLGLRPEGYHTYPNLHTPTFDFNDGVLPLGIDLFRRLALEPI
jgi:amidohydrolase